MREAIEAANEAAKQKTDVEISAGRQDVLDLLDAEATLRSMNPQMHATGQRLRDLARRIRDALDKKEAP